MIRFYASEIAETLTLPETDSGHCTRVLRMREGDEIEVVDGKGKVYTCRIVAPHQRHTMVEIVCERDEARTWKHDIVVGVAPTKHLDRMEWLTEKLTEVGVDRIVPLLTQRSERRELKSERLEKIAVSAMKQSLKAVLPKVSPMTPFNRFLEETRDIANRYIAYCDESLPRVELWERLRGVDGDVAIAIGPEGDFTQQEIKAALEQGWQPVSLGPSRLRTETAALVATTAVHILHND